LWRAQWSEAADPFADVARLQPTRMVTRGPGWQRAASQEFDATPKRVAEPSRSAASFAAKPRADVRVGTRVFHDKFGYGTVVSQEGNKLEIEFEGGSRKRLIDSFVKLTD
jgi:DNA helicase-2/ATP-dependent DNA helicase PcrA